MSQLEQQITQAEIDVCLNCKRGNCPIGICVDVRSAHYKARGERTFKDVSKKRKEYLKNYYAAHKKQQTDNEKNCQSKYVSKVKYIKTWAQRKKEAAELTEKHDRFLAGVK